ncbi:MAG: hypothetical protein M0R38_09840 [Bacteroidia bacterium]|nr:hypothetical protein [Bacteroidia bacterium]
MKKLFSILVMLIAFNQLSNAQGQTCLPTDIDYCTSTCGMVCEIDNQTDCDLHFAWGYQGSGYPNPNEYIGFVLKNSNVGIPNPLPWIGPCMRFCDGTCQCPTLFRLLDPSTMQPIEPWVGNIFNWANQTTTFTTVLQCCGLSGCQYI